MGIRGTSGIRIVRPQSGSAVAISTQQRTPEPADAVSKLLRSISRHGTYPEKRWSNMDSTDRKVFNAIIDAALDRNRELLTRGTNTDTAHGAKFENLESAPFSVDGRSYVIFLARQNSPRTGEPHYRELSILENENRNPKDPRESRRIMLRSNTTYNRVEFVQAYEADRDLWWNMKKTWSFLKRFAGAVDFTAATDGD
jgi:hypothetical protein